MSLTPPGICLRSASKKSFPQVAGLRKFPFKLAAQSELSSSQKRGAHPGSGQSTERRQMSNTLETKLALSGAKLCHSIPIAVKQKANKQTNKNKQDKQTTNTHPRTHTHTKANNQALPDVLWRFLSVPGHDRVGFCTPQHPSLKYVRLLLLWAKPCTGWTAVYHSIDLGRRPLQLPRNGFRPDSQAWEAKKRKSNHSSHVPKGFGPQKTKQKKKKRIVSSWQNPPQKRNPNPKSPPPPASSGTRRGAPPWRRPEAVVT